MGGPLRVTGFSGVYGNKDSLSVQTCSGLSVLTASSPKEEANLLAASSLEWKSSLFLRMLWEVPLLELVKLVDKGLTMVLAQLVLLFSLSCSK